MLFDIPAQLGRFPLAALDKGCVITHAGNLNKLYEYSIKEESQPDTFAFAVFAHKVHAVVPITRADERQAVLTESEAIKDGPHTVFVKSSSFVRPAGKIVIRVLISIYRAALYEVDGFIQHPGVTGAQNVPARSQRQP